MVKIYANIDRKDVVLTFALGQEFQKVPGRLVSVEASGKELSNFVAVQEIPVLLVENAVLVWHGRNAGRVLNEMRKVFE